VVAHQRGNSTAQRMRAAAERLTRNENLRTTEPQLYAVWIDWSLNAKDMMRITSLAICTRRRTWNAPHVELVPSFLWQLYKEHFLAKSLSETKVYFRRFGRLWQCDIACPEVPLEFRKRVKYFKKGHFGRWYPSLRNYFNNHICWKELSESSVPSQKYHLTLKGFVL